MKEHKLGLVCGRFGHIHDGHKLIIDKSIELCEKTLVLVGSAQEQGTLRNPFSADFRIRLIKKVYQDKNLYVEKMNDMTNEYDISHEWGEYVINNTKKHIGRFADLIVTGNDDLRRGWFSEEQMKDTKELTINRKELEISATTLRGYLLINDKQSWEKYVPTEIIDEFDDIRQKLLKVEVYREILEKMEKDITIENYKKVYKVYEENDKKQKMKHN